MKITALGTGHWSSRSRRPASFLVETSGTRILLECPVHVPDTLAHLNLPKPDVVLVTHTHPGHYHGGALRSLYHNRLITGVRRGLSIDGLSIRTLPVSHGPEPTVGFTISRGSTKLVAFAPDFSSAPDELFRGAICAIVDAAAGPDLHFGHATPESLKRQLLSRCGVANVLLTHIAQELPNPSWARVPSDLEVITMSEEYTFPMVVVPNALTLLAVDGALIVKSRSFVEYCRRPILLADERGVHAKVIMSDPEPISLQRFRDLVAQHGISERARVMRWPGARTLYAFEFNSYETYDPPLQPLGVHPTNALLSAFVPSVNIQAVAEGGKVYKTVDGEKYSASDFLIVEDPLKPTTWHLQVKRHGKPDRDLASGAWAALFSDHRGNPYAGPRKQEAQRKIKSFYRANGWPFPPGQQQSADSASWTSLPGMEDLTLTVAYEDTVLLAPYPSMAEVNPAIKGIKPPVSLAQANEIARWADEIEKAGTADSPWAVAIAQFRRLYKITSDGRHWVKR